MGLVYASIVALAKLGARALEDEHIPVDVQDKLALALNITSQMLVFLSLTSFQSSVSSLVLKMADTHLPQCLKDYLDTNPDKRNNTAMNASLDIDLENLYRWYNTIGIELSDSGLFGLAITDSDGDTLVN